MVPLPVGRLYGRFLFHDGHWLFARQYDRMSTPNNQPTLRKQSDEIPDVPMDQPLPDEIRRRFRENS